MWIMKKQMSTVSHTYVLYTLVVSYRMKKKSTIVLLIVVALIAGGIYLILQLNSDSIIENSLVEEYDDSIDLDDLEIIWIGERFYREEDELNELKNKKKMNFHQDNPQVLIWKYGKQIVNIPLAMALTVLMFFTKTEMLEISDTLRRGGVIIICTRW